MNATQNDINASDVDINNKKKINISENNSSFFQNKKACIIITSISSLVVIAAVLLLIALLTKKEKGKKLNPLESKEDSYNNTENIPITYLTDFNDDENDPKNSDVDTQTIMKESFTINPNAHIQIVGSNYENKNDILIIGKNGKEFPIDENGQITGVTDKDIPLNYLFKGNLIFFKSVQLLNILATVLIFKVSKYPLF